MRYAELDLGGGQLLEVIEYLTPQGTPLAQRPCDPGASHLALRVDDVDALCARLARRRRHGRGHGRRRSPRRAPGTARAASTSRIRTAAASSSSSAREQRHRCAFARAACAGGGLVRSGHGPARHDRRSRRRPQARLRLRRVPRRAGRDHRPRRRRRRRARADADGRRQVALLPDPRARAARRRRRRLAADRADAGSGRRAARARACAPAFLNSTQDSTERRAVEAAFLAGELDLLYVAPERLRVDSTLRAARPRADRALRDRRGALRRRSGATTSGPTT